MKNLNSFTALTTFRGVKPAWPATDFVKLNITDGGPAGQHRAKPASVLIIF